MVGPPNSSPAAPPALKKSTSSSKSQTSIAGFFRKKDSVASTDGTPNNTATTLPKSNGIRISSISSSQSLTPAPSSDAAEELGGEVQKKPVKKMGNHASNGLPSPITPASVLDASDPGQENMVPKGFYSPSRKVSTSTSTLVDGITDITPQAKRTVNYAVDQSSGEEDDEEEACQSNKIRGRAAKRRKTQVDSEDEDVFVMDARAEDNVIDEGQLFRPIL